MRHISLCDFGDCGRHAGSGRKLCLGASRGLGSQGNARCLLLRQVEEQVGWSQYVVRRSGPVAYVNNADGPVSTASYINSSTTNGAWTRPIGRRRRPFPPWPMRRRSGVDVAG